MAKLHFYYSAMNAGKTTTLLQSNYNYQERGMNTLLFTPAFDDRFGVGKIASRIGLQADAEMFNSKTNIYEEVAKQLRKHPIHCVLIDEAQFLNKKQVMQLTDIADEFGIPVLAYGLRSDFMGNTFEGSQYLLAWAESLTEIKTICHCGSKATYNARIDEKGKMVTKGDQVGIGGNDCYVSLCRKHFKNKQTGRSPKQRGFDL